MFDFRHMLSIMILSICDWGIFIFSTNFIKFCFLLVDILILYECCCRYFIHFLLFLIFFCFSSIFSLCDITYSCFVHVVTTEEQC